MAKLRQGTRRLLAVAAKGRWGTKHSPLRKAVAAEIRANRQTSKKFRLGDLYFSNNRKKRT